MKNFKLDGSQTTWLVYADWLEDQGIDATNIRDLAVNDYSKEYIVPTVPFDDNVANSEDDLTSRISDFYASRVGGDFTGVGCDYNPPFLCTSVGCGEGNLRRCTRNLVGSLTICRLYVRI